MTAGLFAAALLPATFLDGGPSLCLARAAGLPWCPGCGMSRALWHGLHGELECAVQLNWRVVVVGPILLAVYFRLGRRAYGNPGR